MSASLLDGKYVAEQYKIDIKIAVEAMKLKQGRAPGLAVILVGDNPASTIYVANKRKACSEVGFNSYSYDLPETTSEKSLLKLIHDLNHDAKIDGILVQLPLPMSINPNTIIEAISPSKDVDGFHPYNLGRLAQKNPSLRPCTPYGVINLLKFYQLSLKGKHAVIVGASNIVGRPMALEFLLAGATVTVCHRLTTNLEQHVRMADFIIVATGICDVVHCDWLNPNQILIDVGIHRLSNGKLRGDVNFEDAKTKVAWITPVPGGVGPMTITSLLQNTLIAANNLNRRSIEN